MSCPKQSPVKIKPLGKVGGVSSLGLRPKYYCILAFLRGNREESGRKKTRKNILVNGGRVMFTSSVHKKLLILQ